MGNYLTVETLTFGCIENVLDKGGRQTDECVTVFLFSGHGFHPSGKALSMRRRISRRADA